MERPQGVGESTVQPLAQEAGGSDDTYDVIVIGGGPAGTTAAIYTVRAALRTLVIDRGHASGALGMAGHIANYPGTEGAVSGVELLQRMRRQAESFGAEFVLDRVAGTLLDGTVKEVLAGQSLYRSRAVVIATGSMGRAQTVPGEDQLVGRGVSYCATCDGAFFQDEDVAVVGNNDEALEELLFLTRFARRVYLLSPTTELRASPELEAEVRAHPRVEVWPGARLLEVLGSTGVEGVRCKPRDGDETVLPVTGVFVYLQGNKPVTDFVQGQLATTAAGCLEVDDLMQTSIPGVFAVGDVLCNHLKQAIISAGEGAIAGMAIVRYLSGRERLRPDWS
jgi:thioredoxin reductase (NADPH)